MGPRDYLQGRILGLGTLTLSSSTHGFKSFCQGLLQGPAQPRGAPLVSGVARVWWRISSVNTPGRTPPRVRIGWTVQDEGARGSLLNPAGVSDTSQEQQSPFLLADAWSGQLEIMGTSFSVSAGFLEEDGAGDGEYVVQATICEGGTGASEQATFTRKVSVPAVGTIDAFIPGSTALVNNGAARVKSFSWVSGVIQAVQIDGVNFFGTTVQRVSTGATVGVGLGTPAEFPFLPEVNKLTLSSGGAVDGSILFRYE